MDAPYLNCDGCRTTLGRAGCPTHRQNASVTIAPSVQWSSSEPVLTHCRHGLDLRTHPRCYLCQPSLDEERLARALHAVWESDGFPHDPDLARDEASLIAKAYRENTNGA